MPSPGVGGDDRARRDGLASSARVVSPGPACILPYPRDYEATVAQARRERDSGIWPPVRTKRPDIGSYDVVSLGAAIWGDHLNPPAKAFLAAHDLSGQTVAPFVSYKVCRLGQVPRNIRKIAPGAKLLEGLAVHDAETAAADEMVNAGVRDVARTSGG